MLHVNDRMPWLKTAVAAVLALLLSASGAQAGGIVWSKDLRQSSREAARQQKPVLVMVEASWCGYCRKMLAETLSNPQVALRINQQFVPVLLNADNQAAVMQQFQVNSFPTILVLNSSQKVLGRIEGYQSAAQLEARLAPFKANPQQPSRKWTRTSFLRAHAPQDTLSAAKQFHG
jgi:thioredoxin-like negative regulator of GroEL